MPPATFTVAGNGQSSVSFTVPLGVAFKPESIIAQIDASGAGITTPELSIATQGGVVMATKRQSETIPAGGTGSATWALRLSDEAAAAPAGIQYGVDNVGNWLSIEATGTEPGGYSIALLADDTMSIFAANLLDILAGPVLIHSDDIELLERHLGGSFIVNSGHSLQTYDTTYEVDAVSTVKITGSSMNLQTSGGVTVNKVGAGGNVLTVNNHLGAPIFQVREDGSLHGKTGQTLIFDL